MTIQRRRYELADEEWEKIRKYFPERYGTWNTVYKRFAKWQEENLFETIFNDLGVDADLQDLSLDSTSCKAHQHSAGAKKGAKTAKQTNILD